MVFYRKYRNQTIDELDNAQVRQSLKAILSKPDSIPHAFLFTGPKGLGKTSSARIVAKVINCTNKQKDSLEPCNACEQCLTTTQGNNLDVFEIDAASNRGIDEIRDLKEKIKLSPVSALKKIYIIDEVHMLTTEAFNALLKTLEEPPAHAVFILCTTEIHKVPSTIFSRCFNITFTKATAEELVRSFKRIMLGEKIEADEDALLAIAKMSDGGFRDGAKLLEEIVSISNGQKITLDLIEDKYHFQNTGKLLLSIVTSFEERDLQKGLQTIQTVIAQGIDMRFFSMQILEAFHDLLLEKIRGSLKEEVTNQTTSLTKGELSHILMLLSKAHGEMKNAVLIQLPLELAFVEWCSYFHSKEEDELSSRQEIIATEKTVVSDGKIIEEASLATDTGVTISSMRKQVGNIAKIKALYGETKVPVEVKEAIKTTDLQLAHLGEDGEITKEWMDTFWKCIISEMKTHNHTIAGVLRGCLPKSFDKKTLIIETAYKFHKEKLDTNDTMLSLENVCKALTGSPVAISIVLKS